jgi:hypothetical protein
MDSEPLWQFHFLFINFSKNYLRAGRPRGRSSSPSRVKNFLFSKSSRSALRTTHPPILWVPGALSPRVKRPGREVDHSPPTSAEVMKMWIYTATPHTPSWRSAQLVKHRDNFSKKQRTVNLKNIYFLIYNFLFCPLPPFYKHISTLRQ